MGKDSELLDKVTLFLIVLVSSILVFSQYQFYRISQGYLAYAAAVLIIVLVGAVIWVFLEKPKTHAEHHGEHIPHMHFDHTELPKQPLTLIEKITYGMVAVVGILVLFNQVQISQASALTGLSSGLTFKSASTTTKVALTGDPVKDAMAIVIPRGTPFYGQQIGVSFDDPIRSLEIIAQMDPAYGKNKVQLTQEEKQRYIKIGTIPTITCEFCCGVKTAVTNDGRPTCGCKHSWGMRGLIAYLVKNYPQLTDDEITKEVAKWKGLFFPKQMVQRFVQEQQSGKYTPDIAALLIDTDSSKLSAAATPVASAGNSQSSSDVAASINDLPSQVGGC